MQTAECCEKINCLLDANAAVKYYHPEVGSEVIKYLLDSSPRFQANIPSYQAIELISFFYELKTRGYISEEVRDGIVDLFFRDILAKKFLLYDFSPEHLKDLEVHRCVDSTPPRKFWHLRAGIMKPKTKCNSPDKVILTLMREMHYMDPRSYLITSDGHVADVAKQFSLQVIDPEKTKINQLPALFDRRGSRKAQSFKVKCKDAETGNSLGSSSTEDISATGMRIRTMTSFTANRKIDFKIENFSDPNRSIEAKGEIVWVSPGFSGVKFIGTIDYSSLSSN